MAFVYFANRLVRNRLHALCHHNDVRALIGFIGEAGLIPPFDAMKYVAYAL